MAGGAAEGRAVRCRCAFFWCGPYACVAPNHSPNPNPNPNHSPNPNPNPNPDPTPTPNQVRC